ncbi:MAG: ABC transporter ATP-binding protein [Phycisphaerae bacterium]|jgi:ABC-2 type transport system ATP-binding protein|nr:ABC transporter ATP-binding protein [Phycisphaerae bacterium]
MASETTSGAAPASASGPASDPASNLGVACSGLRMRYGKTHALDCLDLTIEPGVAMGLVGRNGAGKSTLFRVILGMELPDAGSVRRIPNQIDDSAFLARTGFVPDQLSVYDWMTVGSAIEYVGKLQPRFDRTWSDSLVADLGLDRSKKVTALSRGMQARLAFVLGLSHRPELLLLDEPLLGVDAVSHDAILAILARMRSELGSAMLIASHSLGDLARLTDRIAFIEGGRVVEECATDDLVAHTKRLIVRPEPASFALPPETIHVTKGDGALIVTVRHFTRDLLERLRAGVPNGSIDVIDLTIAEACTDRMRAMEVRG